MADYENQQVIPGDFNDAGLPPTSLAVAYAQGEIDIQITTAKKYPRKITEVAGDILSLTTLDRRTAEECNYALPRGGKPITGPSIRFAEIVMSQYGNCRAGAQVIHIDRENKVIVAEGVFHDLEKNTATRKTVQRRIVDKNGKLFNDDMIVVTGNAACSIALRNAILGAVPKSLWWKAYEAALNVVKGDIKTLAERRFNAIKEFALFGIKPDQVYIALDVAGQDDVALEHLPILAGMLGALKSGEATVEEMFPPKPKPGDAQAAAAASLSVGAGDTVKRGDDKPKTATPKPEKAATPKPETKIEKPEPEHKTAAATGVPDSQSQYDRVEQASASGADDVQVNDDGVIMPERPEAAPGSYREKLIDALEVAGRDKWSDLEEQLRAMIADSNFKQILDLDDHLPIYDYIKALPAWDDRADGSLIATRIMSGF